MDKSKVIERLNNWEGESELDKKKILLELVKMTRTYILFGDIEKAFPRNVVEEIKGPLYKGILALYPEERGIFKGKKLELLRKEQLNETPFLIYFDGEDKVVMKTGEQFLEGDIPPVCVQDIDLTNLIQAVYNGMQRAKNDPWGNTILSKEDVEDVLDKVTFYLKENQLVQDDTQVRTDNASSAKRTPKDITPAITPVRFGFLKEILSDMGKMVKNIGKLFQR